MAEALVEKLTLFFFIGFQNIPQDCFEFRHRCTNFTTAKMQNSKRK